MTKLPEGDDGRFDDERWRLREYFARKVSHEVELINHRMSWLVMSESFLFIAWARSGLVPDSGALPAVVSVVGLCVGLAGFFSIGAAMRVHERMSAIYLDAIERAMKLPQTGYRREDRWTLLCGNTPVVILPSLFSAVWAAAAYQSLRGNPVMMGSRALVICAVVFFTGVFCMVFVMWRPWDDHWKELNLREPLMSDMLNRRKRSTIDPASFEALVAVLGPQAARRAADDVEREPPRTGRGN